MFDGILYGLQTTLLPWNLMMVALGCFAGTFIGLLPGLGPISAIALMIPITYGLEPASGMILMAGVYYGAVFGGSTASILLNAPGCASTVVTALDGYPLAKKGQGGKALALAAYASFTGGTLGAFILLFAAPALAKVSLSFQSADYCALMLVGLTAASAFAPKGQVLKGALMTVLGLMLSTIGIDVMSGLPRFTFGSSVLNDGLSFLLLAMATFAVAEVMWGLLSSPSSSDASDQGSDSELKPITSLKLSRQECLHVAPSIARSSILGFFIGVLPGAGATIAAFLSYAAEKYWAPVAEKLKFGKGALRGLAAPESANNAASTGSFVPLLTLGIPGSGTTAMMLGALLAYGIQPGPQLYVDHPEIFWSVIISMYVGNVVLLALNLPLIPYLAKILQIPRHLLIPLIILFSILGVYLVSFNALDVQVLMVITVVALGLRALNFPMAPMLLGFILGGLFEKNLSRALTISDGQWHFIWDRPLALSLFTLAGVMMLWPVIRWVASHRQPTFE